jgi:hypothetical protein
MDNCGTSLTMDKDGSEGEPRMDYYPKMHLDVYVEVKFGRTKKQKSLKVIFSRRDGHNFLFHIYQFLLMALNIAIFRSWCFGELQLKNNPKD